MPRSKVEISHFFKGIGVSIGGLARVVARKGEFREIKVFEHAELGKVFLLDNEIQHVEAWAPLYHEPLVHLPASFVKKVRSVLILGGGTLFAAAEALKYKCVKRVVVVDHDPEVSEVAASVYPHAKSCVSDSRCLVLGGDAYNYASNTTERFDLIINDGGDLLNVHPKTRRDGTDFFNAMARLTATGGVCADVVFRHIFERRRTVRTIQALSRDRLSIALSLIFLPEYHGVLHLLTMWGGMDSAVIQNPKRLANVEQSGWARTPSACPCVYYNPRFLKYYLYLPRYLKDLIRIKRKVA